MHKWEQPRGGDCCRAWFVESPPSSYEVYKRRIAGIQTWEGWAGKVRFDFPQPRRLPILSTGTRTRDEHGLSFASRPHPGRSTRAPVHHRPRPARLVARENIPNSVFGPSRTQAACRPFVVFTLSRRGYILHNDCVTYSLFTMSHRQSNEHCLGNTPPRFIQPSLGLRMERLSILTVFLIVFETNLNHVSVFKWPVHSWLKLANSCTVSVRLQW